MADTSLTRTGYKNLRGMAKTLEKVGKRKRYSRRLVYSSTLPLSKINDMVHDAVLGCSVRLSIDSTQGFNDGSGNYSQALQMIFCLTGLQYNTGSNPLNNVSFSNYASWGTIYDQYKLKKVEVEYLFTGNTSAVGGSTLGSGSFSLPIMYTVIDYDDNSPLTSAANALGYSTCSTTQLGANGTTFGKQYKYLNRPTVQTQVTYVGGSGGGQFTVSPWLNTDNTQVAHYGLKTWLWSDAYNTTNQTIGYVTFNIRAHFQFKNIK